MIQDVSLVHVQCLHISSNLQSYYQSLLTSLFLSTSKILARKSISDMIYLVPSGTSNLNSVNSSHGSFWCRAVFIIYSATTAETSLSSFRFYLTWLLLDLHPPALSAACFRCCTDDKHYHCCTLYSCCRCQILFSVCIPYIIYIA